MNVKKLKKEFYKQEGIDYNRENRKLIKSKALRSAWRKFKKEHKGGN